VSGRKDQFLARDGSRGANESLPKGLCDDPLMIGNPILKSTALGDPTQQKQKTKLDP
jgi:hypothetical protein